MENSQIFKDWLTKELKSRKWSYRELERRAGRNASNSLTSQIMSDKKPITWDFCAAVAGALGRKPEEVFRIAGLLPDEPIINGNGKAKIKIIYPMEDT